jgi:sporulation protein YlmC with PRC-barrel domain
VRLELLIGRPVVATNGRTIGRVEEMRAETRGEDVVVSGVLIGPQALLERLSMPVRELFGRRTGYVARPDQIDLGDPHHPRLRVQVEELEKL